MPHKKSKKSKSKRGRYGGGSRYRAAGPAGPAVHGPYTVPLVNGVAPAPLHPPGPTVSATARAAVNRITNLIQDANLIPVADIALAEQLFTRFERFDADVRAMPALRARAQMFQEVMRMAQEDGPPY